MKISIKYHIFILAILALSSCHKDTLVEGTGESNTPEPTIQMAVNGSVLGYVYDEQNVGVGGAEISLKGNFTTTDQYGVFKFNNVELDQNGSYIKVVKNGYILGSDMIFAVENGKHTSRVKLLSLQSTGSFESNSGGTIEVQGGGKIVFSSSAVENSNGTNYSGTVEVTAKRIATNDPLISDVMPGGLMATDKEGRSVILGSLGMIAVELRDGSGQELNLKEGTTAEITFPITSTQQNVAPATIALWSFDEDQGWWKEEGIAVKSGSNYIANVSHFSFWNCDAPFAVVSVEGKILYENGDPASQIQVTIEAEGLGVGYGWTNNDGSFSGKIPKDQVLTLKVHNALCKDEESITEIELGPFANNTVLDDIIISLPNQISFEGIVVCSGDPIAGASILYSYADNTYVLESNSDGSFHVNITDACGDISEISVFAIDPITGTGSLTKKLDLTSEIALTLEVCNDCNFEVTIEANPDVDPCDARVIQARVVGNGNYSYLWSNGSTEIEAKVGLEAKQYCVTVTEIDLLCSMVVCSDEKGFYVLEGSLRKIESCDGANGKIYTNFSGGYPPYEYSWSDPGLVVENDSIVNDVPPGNYEVTVTDSQGCTFRAETVVAPVSGLTVELVAKPDCYGANLDVVVTGGEGPYKYNWEPNISANGTTDFNYVYQDGNYCVEVIDANGCTGVACVEVVIEDFLSSVFLDITNCIGGTYTLTNNSAIEADIFFSTAVNSYTIPVGGSVDVDFIADGFTQYFVYGYILSLQCEFEGIPFEIPSLILKDNQTTTYKITNATCDTCNDGGITLTDEYKTYTALNGAVPGDILILDSDYNDVTATAETNMLVSGIYYVVVTDANTGCYIYSQQVKI